MVLLAALALTPPSQAQAWEANPCTGGDAAVKAALTSDQSFLIGLTTNPGDIGSALVNAVSSSHLAAPGQPPPADPDTLIGDRPRDMWSCYYAASAAIDGNPATAWVEGAQGAGAGEVLVVPFNGLDPEIAIGCNANADTFAQNNRPKTVEVHRLLVTEPMPVQAGTLYNAKKFLVHTVTLKDTPDWQPLPVPPHQSPGSEMPQFLAIQIVDVYPGTTYQDTCISEIRAPK